MNLNRNSLLKKIIQTNYQEKSSNSTIAIPVICHLISEVLSLK